MKKVFLLIISFSMLCTMSVVNADTQPVTFSNTETNPCSVAFAQDLSFTIPNAIYDAGPSVGQIAMKLDFQFFGEQNGQLLWQFADAGSPPSAPTCSVAIAPDLSFTLEDVIYDAGPSVGKIAFQAEFKYSGEQNGSLLWYLADIKVDDEPADPTPVPPQNDCGAYVAPGVWKEFDCYNLAAIGKTTNDDPFTPSWRLIGGYWQWGRKGPDSSQWHDTNTQHFAHGPTGPGSGDANEGSISSWDDNYAPDGSWSDTSETANDPCPSGFRVPTKTQWVGVINNNTQRDVGTWAESITNYSSASFFGDVLMLPAAGYRWWNGGHEHVRGSIGSYWTSVSPPNDSGFYGFILDISGGSSRMTYVSRRDGRSIRCVAE